MSDERLFEQGSIITLIEDWTFRVERGRVKGRIWDVMDCNSDPDYSAANAKWAKLIEEKHAILARGVEVHKPHKDWDGTQWVTKATVMEPAPGDRKRVKALDGELTNLWEPIHWSKATLPAGTTIEIAIFAPRPSIDDGVLKFNVLSTAHSGLQFKRDGGTLSYGKRNFNINSGELRSARFAAAESAVTAPGI